MGDELDEMDELVRRQDEEDYFDRAKDELGCIFPGNCHMPGMHYKHECRSLEDCEAFYDEMESIHNPGSP